jgi:isopenicillin-N epimerase
MTALIKDLFLLDPTVVFLNHGSFGACPRPVFAAYQEWQRRLERQPVYFMGRFSLRPARGATAAGANRCLSPLCPPVICPD